MQLGGQDVRKMDWSDKAQLRFGAEYLLSGLSGPEGRLLL